MEPSYFPPGDYTSGLVSYLWNCSRCRVSVTQSMHFRRGDAVWIPPALPAEWNKVGDHIFCPVHKVQTFVDGKLVGTDGQQ